jgi:purine-binding chemotaxis protein CheW
MKRLLNTRGATEAGAACTSLDASGSRHEYLTFTLGAEDYALDILNVQEIRSYERPTAMPGVPAFVKGVVNLRGAIVPIADLRVKFALCEAKYDALTVVIIMNVGDRTVGVVVDGVSDVVGVSAEQIRPAPDFATALDARYLAGLILAEDRMLVLVDIEKVLGQMSMVPAAPGADGRGGVGNARLHLS